MHQFHDETESLLHEVYAIGPFTAWLAERLTRHAVRQTCWQCRHLLCYARTFSPPRLEAAVACMMSYGVYDIASLRFLLEQDPLPVPRRTDSDLDGQLRLPLEDDIF